jgi:hypothetical protein
MRRVIWTTLLCLSLVAVGNAQQVSNAPLTNSGVVQLVKAGFKEKTVIAIINNRPTDFKLDPEELIKLKRNNVSENIILAMLSSQMGTFVASEDDWEGDGFFKDLKRPSSGGDSDQSGTSIFGSGGSSKSSTRTRSGNGGNQNEGTVSGSATVRIIKPPVEGGAENAPAKLEKTPTLNNDGVIRMVEAGFSEGTIIKRIEESPVDFDLSPGKLDELYKKRVTDAIVNAMRTAMGDKL